MRGQATSEALGGYSTLVSTTNPFTHYCLTMSIADDSDEGICILSFGKESHSCEKYGQWSQ
jgi:hypothetical protein